MKNSSNKDMEQIFELLANIKKAEPSKDLYTQTKNRLQWANTIPIFWVRAVTCLLIVLISSDFYVVLNKEDKSDAAISSMIYKTNNLLYNE